MARTNQYREAIYGMFKGNRERNEQRAAQREPYLEREDSPLTAEFRPAVSARRQW